MVLNCNLSSVRIVVVVFIFPLKYYLSSSIQYEYWLAVVVYKVSRLSYGIVPVAVQCGFVYYYY